LLTERDLLETPHNLVPGRAAAGRWAPAELLADSHPQVGVQTSVSTCASRRSI